MDKLVKLFNEGNFKTAIAEVDKVLSKTTDNVLLYIIKSKSLAALNKYDDSLECYTKGLKKFPEDKNLLFEIGSLYLDLKNYDQAIKFLKNAIKIDTIYINALNNLGLAYKESLHYDKAIPIFTKILDLDKKNFLANYNLALTYLLKNDLSNSLKYIDISMNLNPNFIKIYPIYAKILTDLDKFNDAERIYKKGLELEPNNRGLLDGLSNLYIRLGYTKKGLELKYKNTGYYSFDSSIFEELEADINQDFNFSNFIGSSMIKDLTICDEIINFFEKRKDIHTQGIVGERFDLSVKNSMDLSIDPIDFDKEEFTIFKIFLNELELIYKNYVQKYRILKNFKNVKIPTFNVQKYNQGGHFAKLHCERSDINTNHRLFAWMCYLNDLEHGGETHFEYFDQKFQPKKGEILIWPSEWTHAHAGLEVIKGQKYIVTGWINIF